LVGSWLTPDLYRGGALGYKVMGRPYLRDSRTINTINLPSCLCALPVNLDSIALPSNTGRCLCHVVTALGQDIAQAQAQSLGLLVHFDIAQNQTVHLH
jgi:hypothetical protein